MVKEKPRSAISNTPPSTPMTSTGFKSAKEKERFMKEASRDVNEGVSQIGKRPIGQVVMTTRLIDGSGEIREKAQPQSRWKIFLYVFNR